MLVSDKKSALFIKSYCKQAGIVHIVLCPGSRNLPLIVNFSNDPHFKVYSIIDERIAGFFALGIVKALRKPALVITTSGSAAVNLAPAMVEAYYQRLPLIAITADRPANFINKGENQTMLQRGIFSNFVGLELEIEEKLEFEAFEKKIQVLHSFLGNPSQVNNVHINLPFSEPLDRVENILGDFQFKWKSDGIKSKKLNASNIQFKKGQNVIIYLSSSCANETLNKLLDLGVENKNWVVISEHHSGWYHPKGITRIDAILTGDKGIQTPDILITIGETMLSKKFRNYIKSFQNILHYDLSPYPRNWNNLTSKYQAIHLDYKHLNDILDFENTSFFQAAWLEAEKIALDHHVLYVENRDYTEFKLIEKIVNTIDRESAIYWGNSSGVRYGNWTSWKFKPQLVHLANRGVAGIDGVLASALGYRSVSIDGDFYCILGDISMLYESNSLSALSFVDRIKIIVINNHGGKIFEQIHQSQHLGHTHALVTPHKQNFESLAKQFDLEYYISRDLNSFSSQWEQVKASPAKLIFEINIGENETDLWEDYFRAPKNQE